MCNQSNIDILNSFRTKSHEKAFAEIKELEEEYEPPSPIFSSSNSQPKLWLDANKNLKVEKEYAKSEPFEINKIPSEVESISPIQTEDKLISNGIEIINPPKFMKNEIKKKSNLSYESIPVLRQNRRESGHEMVNNENKSQSSLHPRFLISKKYKSEIFSEKSRKNEFLSNIKVGNHKKQLEIDTDQPIKLQTYKLQQLKNINKSEFCKKLKLKEDLDINKETISEKSWDVKRENRPTNSKTFISNRVLDDWFSIIDPDKVKNKFKVKKLGSWAFSTLFSNSSSRKNIIGDDSKNVQVNSDQPALTPQKMRKSVKMNFEKKFSRPSN